MPSAESGEKVPGVLVMYGISGDKDSGTVADVAKVLNREGMAVLRMDWPGGGERGDISKKDRVTDTDVLAWTIGDYKAAFDYMEPLPQIDSNRLGFVGASMG